MAQYLTAQWDYTAEGNYELSFKEGDQIKLLEKHNDDWWEGELNDEIGFFPANRTIAVMEEIVKKKPTSTPATPKCSDSAPEYNQILPPDQRPAMITSNSNPYLQQSSTLKRDAVSAPILPDRAKVNLLVDISTESSIDDLPAGWSYSYDQSGTIYFFNKSTNESQWEKPTDKPTIKFSTDDAITDLVYDIKKLNLDALHPNWIRKQSVIQMKIITDEEISWKEYYAVLAVGYLLIYKEGLNKTSRRPSSMKSVAAFGTINLQSSEITPATKSDTRKKNAFIITNSDLKVVVSVANESLYSDWLDAIMRELISLKENQENQDMDLVQLLASIPLKDKITKNKPDITQVPEESKLTRWFSRSSRNSISNKHHIPTEPPPVGKEIFGGYLKLEEGGGIPLVVRLCIEQVDRRGLDVVGIYRLSGQTTSIQKYKNQFSTNPEDVNLEEENDINVITGLLKLYFRELKNPLLTFEYYDRVIEAARLQDYDERMFRLKSIIQVLPVPNYKVFQYLVRHLERVKDQSKINKMEASNLALIFSIGLLRSKQDDLSSSILHSDLLSKVMETIIQHVDWFFDTDTDDELLIEDTSVL